MQVRESTLKDLIEGEKQFQVPLYQRQYEWKDEQLSQLWENILEQYDLLTPDENGKSKKDDPNHFIGSLVMAPSPAIQASGVTSFLVIDGQQRLTTLLIALCALRDLLALDDPKVTERFNDRYLINKYEKDNARYRLLPTQADRESFCGLINQLDLNGNKSAIGNAYSFFKKCLTQPGPDNEKLDAERLENVIRQRLQFVDITTGSNDNVHRIFESLNNSGLGLTQADLLRNYIFMLLPNKSEHVYKNTWLPMQEKLTSDQLEDLVFVDLVVRGETTIKRPDIYRGQQERLRGAREDENAIESEVRELARRANLFQKIVQPENERNPAIQAALNRLNDWGSKVTYPLLLHLYILWEDGQCTSDEVEETLSYVESFLVRRMLAEVPTNNLNRIFNALVSQLPSELPIAEAVRQVLSESRKRWPSDDKLRDVIRTVPFYYQGRGNQKMMIFRRLEESYGHAEPINWSASKLTIEHIMPQSLTDEWKQALVVSGEVPEEIHSTLRHTLGNLTVTAYNGELSNSLFERKRQILQGSHLELNRAVSASGQWGQDEILERADELADKAITIWPGPITGVDNPEDKEQIEPAISEELEHNWQWFRELRYLKHFYEAPDGRLHKDEARELAIQEGYDPRGTAGFYQGTGSLRREGDYRVLTDAGRQKYLRHRHQLN